MRTRVPWWGPVWAEFVKIWDLRLPAFAFAAFFLFATAIAYQAVHYELLLHEPGLNTVTAAGWLLYGAWGRVVALPLYVLILGVYVVAMESQYGMTRIACTQPVSRRHYACAKMLALALHAAVTSALFSAVLLGWSVVLTRFKPASRDEWLGLLLACGLMMLNCVTWAWMGAAVALLRRTLLGAMLSAFVVLMVFFWWAVTTHSHNAENWLMYHEYPLGPVLPMRWVGVLPNMDEPLWKYLLVMLGTPLLFFLPALTHLQRRDITE